MKRAPGNRGSFHYDLEGILVNNKPEMKLPTSSQDEAASKHKAEIKKLRGTYITPIFWIVAISPIVYRALYPAEDNLSFLQSALDYILLAAFFFITIGVFLGGIYLTLAAVCQLYYNNRNKITLSLFGIGLLLFLIF